MFKNRSLRIKLFSLLFSMLLLLILTNFYNLSNLKSQTQELADNLYSKSFVVTDYVLNADRDMYQALTAQKTLLYIDHNDKAYEEQFKAYQENIGQARDRVNKAKEIIEKNSDIFKGLKSTSSNKTAFESVEIFDQKFEVWEKESSEILKQIASVPLGERQALIEKAVEIDSKFEASREVLSDIEDIMDVHAKNVLSQSEQENTQLYIKLVVFLIVISALATFVSWYFIQNIVKSIKQVVKVTAQVAQGDLSVENITSKSKDEIGELAQSVNVMVKSLKDLIVNVRQTTTEVAASSQQLAASAEQTSKASEQITSIVQELADGSQNQVDSVEKGSKAVEKISESAQQIAQHAESASSLAEVTAEKSFEGGKAIQAAIGQMNSINHTVKNLAQAVEELGGRSKEIGQIVETITEIADKTNLLALNAAIESARAGEHGRGFAVVAEEVRKLAEQASVSTQQISDLIVSIQADTDKAVSSTETATGEVSEGIDLVNSAGDTFEEIEESVNKVAERIKVISAGALEMSSDSEQVVSAVNLITEVAQEAAAGAQNVSAATEEQLASMEEIFSSSSSLSQTAENLQGLVAAFKLEK